MKLDSGTAQLIADLQAEPPSFARDEMIARARRLLYHDYESPYAGPECVLVKHLTNAGYPHLARRALDGRYDQPKSEGQKWAEGEGAELEQQVMADPKLQEQLDTILEAAKKHEPEARKFMLSCIASRNFKHPVFSERKTDRSREVN